MTVANFYSNANDGYILDEFGIFGSPTTIITSTSSSSDSTENRGFIPIDTSIIGAGGTVNSAQLFFYVRSHTFNDVGSNVVFYAKQGGVTYPLVSADWDLYLSGVAVGSAAMDDLGDLEWYSIIVATAQINKTGITNFLTKMTSADIPGDTLTIDSFEHASGNKPYLLIDYTPAAGAAVLPPKRALFGIGS